MIHITKYLVSIKLHFVCFLIYNPQNRLFVIPKRNVSVLRPFSKTKRLFLKQNQTAFKWASNPI